ncbi:MAG TPA: zf-HC2 domain-containing protein [Candidatus Kryptonia bacterium]|nr:zf-HC2 domain-containing protein [Candidatus Kryptonia bacterium]
MVDPYDILNRWHCRRLAPRLVDFAEGALDMPARARVERHVETCARCTEALAALRDVPDALRDSAVTRSEDFWQQQRQDIMRAIRHQAPKASPRPLRPPAAAWRGGLVAVATALLAVAGYRVLLRSHAPLPKVSKHASVASVDDLETETMVALSELVSTLAPQSELMPAGRELDAQLADDIARSPWIESPETDDALANDLDDAEWERRDDLSSGRAG